MKGILILTLLSSFTSQAALRVTLDPGHGGEDKGAVHHNIQEADVALQISQKLHRLLKKDRQFQSQLLRHNDKSLSLEQRVRLSKKFKAQLYVSIHANAHSNNKAHGAEFYIENQLPPSEEFLRLAHYEVSESKNQTLKPLGDVESIVSDLRKSHRILSSYQVSSYLRKNWSKRKSKMIRQGPFYVLNQNSVPAVLVEVGYLSNPQERRLLTQSREQLNIAKKIHRALKDYAKNIDKLPSSILKPQNAKTR